MKNLLAFLLILTFGFAHGQTVEEAEKALRRVKTMKQAEKFKAKYSDWKVDFTAVLSDVDSLQKYKKSTLISLERNGTISIKKIVRGKKVVKHNASYIVVDGKLHSKAEIDKIRNTIIKKYNSGVPFSELIAEYAKTPSAGANLGWFPDGVMVEPFEDAVKNHKKGDIFTTDYPEADWHHVVLKNEDDKKRPELQWISVEIPKSN